MPSSLEIVVGARNSPLSKKQVEEVWEEVKAFHPHVLFRPLYMETRGDRDKVTSLRTLEKTDFFTREIDEKVLQGVCRIGIHSAKDLPQPLREGLQLVALTKGVSGADVLVLRDHERLALQPRIATSSARREECIKRLFPHAICVEIRGTIEERLQQLDTFHADGVVMAEAALLRLGIKRGNQLPLPGETALHQGRLAIVARTGDYEMEELFSVCAVTAKSTATTSGTEQERRTSNASWRG